MKKTVFLAISSVFFFLAGSVYAVDYNWGNLLKNNDAWFAGTEAGNIGDTIVKYQLSNGGWRKAMDDTGQTGEWAKATTDNDATTSQINYLARLYKATNTAKYLTSFQKGLDLLINGQYSNGGWPQIFGASSGSYHTHITYNDGAMIRVLEIMKAVSEKSGNFTFVDNDRAAKAKTAMEKGVDCIIRTQIVFNSGEKTAWCQQHDMSTLAPASARAYELPSVSGSESAGIVNFLKSYHNSLGNNPRLDVVQSINAAVSWMDKVKIVGIRVDNVTTNGEADRVVVTDAGSTLWARFYELQTNKPIFVGRDGVIKYALKDIEQERRAGYAYYGNWPSSLVKAGVIAEPTVSSSSRLPSSSSVTPPSSSSRPLSSSSISPANIGSGEFIGNLIIFDPANAAAWAINRNFAVNAKVYGDRDFLATSVPAGLLGTEWVRTSMETRRLTAPEKMLEFKMKKDGIVFVLYEDRVTTKPSWLSAGGFSSTGEKVSVNDNSENGREFTVYSKFFLKDETVTMGINSNDGTTSSLMYLIAAKALESTPILNGASPASSVHFSVRSLGGKTLLVETNSPTVMDIFDLKGNIVRTLNFAHGNHLVQFNDLPQGLYIVKASSGSWSKTIKVPITSRLI